MAMSGTAPASSTEITDYLYLQYDWSVTFDTVNMKANWRVSATVKRSNYGSSDYSKNFATRLSGNDWIKFNDVIVWYHEPGDYNDNSNNPYVYTGDKSVCADCVSPSTYTGTLAGKKPYGLSHLLSDKPFQTDIDINGNTSLRVTTSLTGAYAHNITAANNYTFTPDQAELYTKLPYKQGAGSSGWSGTAYIWYKQSAGSSGWVRKYLYRKDRAATQSDSGWVKK